MMSLIIDAVVFFFLFQKIREFYFYCLLTWDQIDRQNEYILWKENRLPYLIHEMKGDSCQLHYLPKIIDHPTPGYEKEIDKKMNDTWALAERLARSNHMRKDWGRFGPIEGAQYEY